MNNIYLIESPIQLKSAISYSAHLKLKNNILILIKSNSKNENTQIDGVLNKDKWDNIYILSKFNNRFLNIIYMFFYSIFFFLKYRNKVDRVMLGDYRNFFFILISRLLKFKEEILLDDGTIVVYLQYKYFRNSMIYEDYCSFFRRIILRFVSNVKSVPNLYSIFELSCWHDVNQVNYFVNVKKKNTIKSKDIYFFGSKYSECGLITLYDEIDALSKVYKKLKLDYEIDSIIYIPHRSDSDEKIKMINSLGFTIKRLNLPAEAYFESLDSYPFVIAGFYTTVLYSLNYYFDFKSVISFDINPLINDNHDREGAKLIYDYYKNVGINVIDLS
ncbi:polysialyltransferase family glycosyltransferase [Photobacterium leiognathi]|uniref:polysialyltransferase family glycosyltransferase n=1 Tax=Photobacterium leiognathi TaxID=553611 RepID=UPI0029827AB9|nr:polysialyltransferase family glycosyltransferase [Photobacterium leiognathi]